MLDTNVLSELMRPAPDAGVSRWVAAQPAPRLFTTSITQAEILHGIRRLPAGKRRDAFERAASALFDADFAGRVLPFDTDAALPYATIVAERQRLGRPITAFDAQIAAVASSRGAALATRNVTDFDQCGIVVVDPWSAGD